jgi:hypothetical protein
MRRSTEAHPPCRKPVTVNDARPRSIRRATQLSDLALELAIGSNEDAELGEVAAEALFYLANAIVRIAALNSEPRLVIDRIVALLDVADTDKIRKERSQ